MGRGSRGRTLRGRNWGARPSEVSRAFAESELLPGPDASLTQGVTVDAPPMEVWPWLVQLGQDKGGFYSYARLESLFGAQVTNADSINPAWQETREGDPLLLHPSFALRVQRVRPPTPQLSGRFVAGRAVSKGVGFQWIFDVAAEGEGTRLVVRERYVVPSPLLRPFARVATWGSAVMSQRMLRGVRDRAERSVV